MTYPQNGPVILILALVFLSACQARIENDARTDAAYGQKLFLRDCAACHGKNAAGGGPASLGLGARPPSLLTLSATNGGSFPQDYVMSKIYGFNIGDHRISAMPDFGKGDLGPLVQVERDGVSTPIPADLIALAVYIESLQVGL